LLGSWTVWLRKHAERLLPRTPASGIDDEDKEKEEERAEGSGSEEERERRDKRGKETEKDKDVVTGRKDIPLAHGAHKALLALVSNLLRLQAGLPVPAALASQWRDGLQISRTANGRIGTAAQVRQYIYMYMHYVYYTAI
jgi:hypothetical protein